MFFYFYVEVILKRKHKMLTKKKTYILHTKESKISLRGK